MAASGCRACLVGDWVEATQEVSELPVAPVRVIKHQDVARVCPLCQRRRVPLVELFGVVLDRQQQLGSGLVSRIVTLREAWRLPFTTILWFLARMHRLHLSVGELAREVRQVAARAKAQSSGSRERSKPARSCARMSPAGGRSGSMATSGRFAPPLMVTPSAGGTTMR
jgi:hypothetical protein